MSFEFPKPNLNLKYVLNTAHQKALITTFNTCFFYNQKYFLKLIYVKFLDHVVFST